LIKRIPRALPNSICYIVFPPGGNLPLLRCLEQLMKSASFWISIAFIAASIEPIIVKLGYLGSITPAQLLVVKCVVGALVLLPLARAWRWVGWRAAGELLFAGLLLLGTNGLTMFALQHLSAVTVVTIVATTPAFVGLTNQLAGRDVLGPKFWLGFVLCFVGVVLGLDMQDFGLNWVGVLQILGAVATSTIYRVRMERMTAEYSPLAISAYTFMVCGVLSSVSLAPWVGSISPSCWMLGIWIGLSAVAANVAFLYLLRLVGSTKISIINMLQRPALIIAAAVILKEPFTPMTAASVALVLVGVQLATSIQRRQDVAIAELTVPAQAER
jgi:drug/metabolite transporter (DMT)-like permease